MGRVQSLKEEDLGRCADLYVKVFNAEPWNDEWTLEFAYSRLNDIFMSPNFVGVFYEEGNELEGAVLGNCEYWYQGMHYNLKEMFVTPELQGSGIGSKLLKGLEERLEEFDVSTMILFTSKGNKTNDFYKKNNFIELDSMAMMAKDI